MVNVRKSKVARSGNSEYTMDSSLQHKKMEEVKKC